MKKRVKSYLNNKNNNNFLDIDLHEFIELVSEGYSTIEIAKELGVPKEHVIRLKNELNKNY